MSFADITPDQQYLRDRYFAWNSSQKPTYRDFEEKYTQWLSDSPTVPEATLTTESLFERFFNEVYKQPKADPVQLQTPTPPSSVDIINNVNAFSRAPTGRTFGRKDASTYAPNHQPEKKTKSTAQKSTHWIFAIFQAIAELFKGIFQ